MNPNELASKAEAYVKELFREKYDSRSAYHSFEHTREVAEAARKIGRESGLKNEELDDVVLAAWFHDTGYLFRKDDHESASAETARQFLEKEHVAQERVQRIIACIMATRINHVPENIVEEVIHDADYINLANDDNLRQSELLRRESVNYGAREPSEEEWLMAELKFLLNHRYYTAYGKRKLDEKKSDNIRRIRKKLKKLREAGSDVTPSQNGEQEKVQKLIEKKEVLSVKGFDSIYRLSATNHMRLNAIADRKANIMLTLNGIIISLTLTLIGSAPEMQARMIVPSSLLILVCLGAIIFATLSTRPKITSGTIAKEDIEDKKANLLFFGNFSRMDFEDFDWGLRKMITDQDYLHNSMIRDFYDLGKVLDMKFRYLRICYNIFMYGIIASVLCIAVMMSLGY